MDLKTFTSQHKNQYNKSVTHIIQSWEWGNFRQSLGTKLKRFGFYENGKLKNAFQITFHKIPLTNYFAGYLPKGPFPSKELAEALTKIGQENHCAFIKVEPNIEESSVPNVDSSFKISPKSLFTKFNYILDLTKSEEEILKNMHPKFRYNIKVAQRHGVKVEERADNEAFQIYLRLYFETAKRQKYHGHNIYYHQKVWETLKKSGMAKLLIASYNQVPLATWMLFKFKDTLYYPYGGSSIEHRNVMAANSLLWEAIKLGKKLKLKSFDLWGAASPAVSPKHPWQGFTRFKRDSGASQVEYLGTYDLVLNWPIYILFNSVEKVTPVKLFLLKILGK